ncbi:MAG: class I SAM-dependent methyltransferase [Cyanobacteria bacterium P01_D01_bin.2]
MENVTERFSSRVADYVSYRPGYPSPLLAYLVERYGLRSDQTVADVGSGTGLLTQLFLKHGNGVYGVEPNAKMRAAAETLLQPYADFISVDGRAEATTLAPRSVDWIVAGQAFHWFDPVATRREFVRILGPGGRVALIWNDRRMDDPFQQAYEQFLLTHAPDYSRVNHRRVTLACLKDFFAPHGLDLATFDHGQVFDFEGLQGRLLSCSYAPTAEAAGYGEMMAELRSLFNQYSHQGRLMFPYTTRLYCAQLS